MVHESSTMTIELFLSFPPNISMQKFPQSQQKQTVINPTPYRSISSMWMKQKLILSSPNDIELE